MEPYLKSLAVAAALAAMAIPAQAQTPTVTASDIVMHDGPGQDFPEIGLITRGSHAMLNGCMEDSNWCLVEINGMEGWVFAQYLTIEEHGAPILVEEYRTYADIPVVTYETTAAITGSPPSPAPGDIMLGPVEDVIVVEPPEDVYLYIEQHRPETFRVENEVLLGAAVPSDITVQEVPDYEYDYVVINERPVLVDPQTRRIMYIYD